MSKSKYIELSRNPTILRDIGGYDHALGEMNPVIFEDFVGLLLDNNLTPIIWEPFSSNSTICKTQEFASSIDGLTLISYSLKPCDGRVVNADSTNEYPKGCLLGGMLLHPPYFGAMPFSNDRRDVALLDNKDEYLKSISKVVFSARQIMEKDGLACVVCRSYRSNGENIRLDHWFLEIFESLGFTLEDVWFSEPDVVLIMKNGKQI